MWDTGTWILLTVVIAVIAVIVVLSVMRGARRRRIDDDTVASRQANPDNTLGDRRDALRRARGRI